MEIEFPIEFLVYGTPVSLQRKRRAAIMEWQERVKKASATAIPAPHYASGDRIAVTLYYLPGEPMEGDIDNIVKPILDALSNYIYIDDKQVERIAVQKFEPGNIFNFARPTTTFVEALTHAKPVLYVRISNDPFEELA
jgi:crossover junction endodeoxyribonuclease RusA